MKMRSLKGVLAVSLVVIFGIVLPLELLLGYIRFRHFVGESAIRHFVTLAVVNALDRGTLVREELSRPAPQKESHANPFLGSTDNPGHKLHPFIDYTNAHGSFASAVDYFGFRNDRSLYFAPRARKLVVISGGSEVAGYTHQVPIAENLERFLNENEPGAYQVLNLGMNSYVLANEISAYVHLAYHLRPDYVVSHTGYNDVMYGLMVPPEFKRLGLNYFKNMEDSWLPRLYDLKPGRAPSWSLDEREYSGIVPAVLANMEKYRNIVSHNGGKFISGIQPYEKELHAKAGPKKMFSKGGELLRDLNRRASTFGVHTFDDWSHLTFSDHIHTTDESSVRLAQFYAERIQALERKTLPIAPAKLARRTVGAAASAKQDEEERSRGDSQNEGQQHHRSHDEIE